MNYKRIFLLLLIVCFHKKNFGQETTFKEVMNGIIFSADSKRAERLKKKNQIEKVKIYYYNLENLDTLNPEKNVFEVAHLYFDTDGKLTSKTYEDLEDNKNWIDYTYDRKGRLTEKITHYKDDQNKRQVLEKLTFEYFKDKVIQIDLNKQLFDSYTKREFFVSSDGFIDKIDEYEEDGTKMKFRSFFLMFYENGDFWDFVEGIESKEDAFRPISYIDYTYDDKGRVTSKSHGNSKEIFTYKNDALIQYCEVKNGSGKEIRKANYTNDENGNWTAKVYFFEGEIQYFFTREITYRK